MDFGEFFMLINCIIPGGQRCGSTYLFKLISNFENVKNPISLKSEPKWFLKRNSERVDCDAYMREVFGVGEKFEDAIYLEKSTSYLTDYYAANRINQILGQIPIIVIIRNPIARAISHFEFSKKNGFEKLDFQNAIYLNPNNRSYSLEELSANPFRYVENGLFYEHLSRWQSIFPRLKVVFLEDLIRDPSTFIEICEFIGLKKDLARKFWNTQRINQGTLSRNEISIQEIEYLQTVFLEPNMLLQRLLGRELPPEWSSLP